MVTFRHPLLRGAALLWWLVVAPVASAETLLEEASQAQRTQAELQARIDAADDEVRERLEELRRLERETRRLDAENDLLAPRLARQAETLSRRETALATLTETREALPALERGLVERLASWVEQDLPFLAEERRARVASLESDLADPEASAGERLERILAAWRTELDYGREFDAWRGYLTRGEVRRKVEFLRFGRVGYYYLTSDGRQGGVWLAEESRWLPLDDDERSEVRMGLRIARDQRAPKLLELPVSQPLISGGTQEERS
ncbi:MULTISPECIES: DUF3450 domain-containing protein [Halomonas]|uniref:DUF3450 domain-containing protein n=1 Tax=Halomonas TaxID=2745 RepID=UPI0026D99CB4|nr:DUF3450 domain-containing protein [Halomonas sp. LBP4]